MQIIINHVTRMTTQSRICVAGIEKDAFAHVRPTTPRTDLITRALLRSEGGPFGPGAVVDLGPTTPEGQRPEVEDHRFLTANAAHVEDLSDELYLAVLKEVSHAGVVDAFGFDVVEVRPRKLALPAGHGERSLAVVELEAPRLYVDSWGNLYIDLDDGVTRAKLRVTDVRFYEADHKTIKVDVVNDVARRIAGGVQTYGMLGVARAMWDDDGGNVHWLQCNGICLADHAVRDVP